ncbi:hypothetical protein ALC53_01925 [Atta colombica]|uniref:Uncharacterized protein n=1 Tax=Atta colombica TaxID=520822 RepID=A0A195BSH3_9HYME|nr:hypothetical protein ALC53_01925 [Atta colombica]
MATLISLNRPKNALHNCVCCTANCEPFSENILASNATAPNLSFSEEDFNLHSSCGRTDSKTLGQIYTYFTILNIRENNAQKISWQSSSSKHILNDFINCYNYNCTLSLLINSSGPKSSVTDLHPCGYIISAIAAI